MPVDFDMFVDWAEKRFDNVKINGKEVRINSVFTEDQKNHLWCNPEGGKRKINSGVYHCFKSEKKGTLLGLVMHVDKCSKNEAMQILGIKRSGGRPIEDELELEFGERTITAEELYESAKFKTINLPPHTMSISLAPEMWYQRAKNYMASRNLDISELYICLGGKYSGRIIIPYYDEEGNLIYFNGRSIVGSELRYRGPEKDIGVGKEDVLYFTKWPSKGEKIYLCEGEFDAMSLKKVGLNSVACGGKNLSDKQAILLSKYKVCMALDADEAGQSAISKMVEKLNSFSELGTSNRITFVRPPSIVKDWNEFLIHHDTQIIRGYIDSNESSYESEYSYG